MPIKNHSETEKVKALGEQIAVKAKKSSSSFIDDECEWINDVVSCKKCREPVHIAFFHGSPITYCPKCKKMHGFPYEDLLVEKTRKGKKEEEELRTAFAKSQQSDKQEDLDRFPRVCERILA